MIILDITSIAVMLKLESLPGQIVAFIAAFPKGIGLGVFSFIDIISAIFEHISRGVQLSCDNHPPFFFHSSPNGK